MSLRLSLLCGTKASLLRLLLLAKTSLLGLCRLLLRAKSGLLGLLLCRPIALECRLCGLERFLL